MTELKHILQKHFHSWRNMLGIGYYDGKILEYIVNSNAPDEIIRAAFINMSSNRRMQMDISALESEVNGENFWRLRDGIVNDDTKDSLSIYDIIENSFNISLLRVLYTLKGNSDNKICNHMIMDNIDKVLEKALLKMKLRENSISKSSDMHIDYFPYIFPMIKSSCDTWDSIKIDPGSYAEYWFGALFDNLLSNAIKYGEESHYGDHTIIIRLSHDTLKKQLTIDVLNPSSNTSIVDHSRYGIKSIKMLTSDVSWDEANVRIIHPDPESDNNNYQIIIDIPEHLLVRNVKESQ